MHCSPERSVHHQWHPIWCPSFAPRDPGVQHWHQGYNQVFEGAAQLLEHTNDRKELNIIDFNESIHGLLDSLAAHDESTQDLLSNLFKGYEAASDEQFVKYVLKKQNKYNEGTEITADTLMLLMSQKYGTLVQAGKWNAPDEKMEKIFALEATIKKLQKASKPKTKKKSTEKPKKYKKKGKGKDEKGRKLEWMLVKPKENEPKRKTVNDKVYH